MTLSIFYTVYQVGRERVNLTMSSKITQLEFAKLCGASKQAVYKAINAGYIKTAKVNKKRVIVFDDPITQLWYEKQIAKNVKAPLQAKSLPESNNEINDKPATDLISLQREKILEEIGKIRADKKLKELQYTQKRDTLIEKDTVAAVLFQYIEALNINMLDMPEITIDAITDKISTGSTRGDIIEFMRNAIKKLIIATKTQIKERLK